MTALSNLALAAALMAGTATTHAALVARGGGMVYDTTLNVTWLADWNLAKSSGYDADGAMDWASAKSWADNLVYGGFDDWRLPSALSADGSGACGPAFDCTSELGHIFYANWGASSGQDYFQGSNTANLALFGNVQFAYWTGTEYAPDTSSAWFFYEVSTGGFQTYVSKQPELYAVAVRIGDVPEPPTAALALMGLLTLALAARKRLGRV
jgi:hypothetical protein